MLIHMSTECRVATIAYRASCCLENVRLLYSVLRLLFMVLLSCTIMLLPVHHCHMQSTVHSLWPSSITSCVFLSPVWFAEGLLSLNGL